MMSARPMEVGDLTDHARYDVPEMSKMARMQQALTEAEGWGPADFNELTFADVECEYLLAGFPEIVEL